VDSRLAEVTKNVTGVSELAAAALRKDLKKKIG
jgi:hypothetical protein